MPMNDPIMPTILSFLKQPPPTTPPSQDEFNNVILPWAQSESHYMSHPLKFPITQGLRDANSTRSYNRFGSTKGSFVPLEPGLFWFSLNFHHSPYHSTLRGFKSGLQVFTMSGGFKTP
jgi:hypothetical protein